MSVRRIRFEVPGHRPIRLDAPDGLHPPDPYAPQFASKMVVRKCDSVLDLGCGAGGYGLAALQLGASRLTVTDVDAAAVKAVMESARRNGLGPVEGRKGSLFQPVAGRKFDVIITSLPQLPSPESILRTRYGGKDGHDFLRKLAARAGRHLNPGGRLYMLITDWANPRAVLPMFTARMFRVRRVCRVYRAFQPAEYDAYAPGLWNYLENRAQRGVAAYRRGPGSWCYLGVSFYEATRRV